MNTQDLHWTHFNMSLGGLGPTIPDECAELMINKNNTLLLSLVSSYYQSLERQRTQHL